MRERERVFTFLVWAKYELNEKKKVKFKVNKMRIKRVKIKRR